MLSLSSKLQLQGDPKEHGHALRAIGQDLADIRFQRLEIDFDGDVYVAHGLERPGALPPPKKTGPLKRFLSKLVHNPQPSNAHQAKTVLFSRSYTFERIHSLGDEGTSKRQNSLLEPDIHVLGERLRAVGNMIEAKNGQLIGLTLEDYRVAFIYLDSQGKVYEEEHTIASLYRDQNQGQPRRLAGEQKDTWQSVRK